MTETILDKIKAYKLEEVAADKAATPLAAAHPAQPDRFRPDGPEQPGAVDRHGVDQGMRRETEENREISSYPRIP